MTLHYPVKVVKRGEQESVIEITLLDGSFFSVSVPNTSLNEKDELEFSIKNCLAVVVGRPDLFTFPEKLINL